MTGRHFLFMSARERALTLSGTYGTVRDLAEAALCHHGTLRGLMRRYPDVRAHVIAIVATFHHRGSSESASPAAVGSETNNAV
jgi:hypothetical protein